MDRLFHHPPAGWRIPANGGTPTAVTSEEGWAPYASPDGKLIAYLGKAGTLIAPFAGGKPIRIIETAREFPIWWTPDSKAVLYIDNREGVATNVFLQQVAGGSPKQITHFTFGNVLNFAPSPDGKALVVSHGDTASDAVLLTNVQSRL